MKNALFENRRDIAAESEERERDESLLDFHSSQPRPVTRMPIDDAACTFLSLDALYTVQPRETHVFVSSIIIILPSNSHLVHASNRSIMLLVTRSRGL